MPKIETPRSFVENNTGYNGAKFNELVSKLSARDTAIRAECAERAIEYIAKHGFAHVSQNVDLFFAAIIGKEIGHA